MSESQPLLNREGQGGALSWADRFGLLLMLRKRMAVSHPYTLRDQETTQERICMWQKQVKRKADTTHTKLADSAFYHCPRLAVRCSRSWQRQPEVEFTSRALILEARVQRSTAPPAGCGTQQPLNTRLK